MKVTEKHIKTAEQLGLWTRRGLVATGEGMFISGVALRIPEGMILGAVLWIAGSLMYVPGFHPVESTVQKALANLSEIGHPPHLTSQRKKSRH